MLITAFIVAFTQYWKLTLVAATTLPAAVLGVGITVALDARLEAKILEVYSKAGGLVEEALGSIRNVAAFGANEKLRKKYDGYLDIAKKFGVKKGPVLGTLYSSEFFMMYCAYALAFWYGIRLLLQGKISNGGTVITYVSEMPQRHEFLSAERSLVYSSLSLSELRQSPWLRLLLENLQKLLLLQRTYWT